MATPQNVIIKFSTDTADLQKARQELGLLEVSSDGIVKKVKEMGDASTKATNELAAGAKKADEALDKVNTSGLNLGKTLKSVGAGIAAYFTLEALVSFGKQV